MTISVGMALVLVVAFAAVFALVRVLTEPGTVRYVLYGVLGFLGFIVLLWAFGLLSSQAIRVR